MSGTFIDTRDSTTTKSKIHYLPFKIEHEGNAEVTKKFTDRSVKSDNDETVLKNQFRGRSLMGKEINLPEGYQGVVLSEFKANTSKLSENGNEEDKSLRLVKEFDSLTYWNWDKRPSSMDQPVKLLDWMKLSQIIHEPIQTTKEQNGSK